ncbi:MAG: Ig-like domain-containing protein [Nitrospirales bacterium]|nr:Ig-like domain-containing protein [Nitrospirales bacterium]
MTRFRHRAVCVLSCALAWALLPASAGAIEIVSPKDGAIVPIGTEIVIQVQPSPGDDIDRAYMAQSDEPLKHNNQTGFFEQKIKLRGDSLGPIAIEVWSKNSKGIKSTARVTVHVNLPPVLPLISLRIHAEQRRMVLEEIGEKRDLQVIGEFPDGTVRFVSRSALGTTYQSRNEEVAKVDANGAVTAVGVGETTIVVRNGDKETQSRVVVRPKQAEGEKKET